MILISNPDKSQWQEILKRPVMNTENLFDTVRSVIDRVKEEGDRAVLDYEEKVSLNYRAILTSAINFHEVLINHTSCTNIKVTNF